jgi:hypothetical protein
MLILDVQYRPSSGLQRDDPHVQDSWFSSVPSVLEHAEVEIQMQKSASEPASEQDTMEEDAELNVSPYFDV